MKPRIIVCGLDRTGYKVLSLLKQQGCFVIGIHDQPIDQADAEIVIGDLAAAETLIAAGIRDAQTLILAGADETRNLTILMQARVLNPHVRIINRLFNSSLGVRLDLTLPNHLTMSVAALAAPVFAFSAMGNRAIGQLRLFTQTWPIHEEYIDDRHAWLGKPLSGFWEDRSRMLIYYLPSDESKIDLVSAVLDGRTLQLGDRLLLGTQPNVRNASRPVLQKIAKLLMGMRQFHEHGQEVLFTAIALLLTIFSATLVYTSLQIGIPFVDALYFSVGMITGAGGNEQVVEHATDNLKIFTIIMMLIGTTAIGIFYAILNDFILGSRLRNFWDAARVPQHNHIIICGLGSVGVQTALQLVSYGYEVIAIERDLNNRFLDTLRSQNIPVIHGDASLPTTLKAANLDKAESLLAVTSNDTENLEIALNAKGIAPNCRVVVRYDDPYYASMAQEVFDFEAVLSPPEIAAPAFAASALGGRILGNGIVADSLWVAIATMITPNHPFCGKPVREASTTADFVPLYIETASQTIHGWNLLESSLNAGDILYLTIPAAKLEQLWRVTPFQVTVS
ncbi:MULTISPECIES: NAD-binding protein [Pseudanabaena]|uniref:TrkA-N domain protein n=2 Tax=Pseudanabaena TaxID=1152 RepID=L8N3N0_9CYAN|nr:MULTISPECIES: NAD-binding protein [Pseudanabaena]ELS33310.1 TrkA-N domain protein [Pseudanabaena biceps PCC 7429]MDG3494491.1 NAD-binding protein [Pseudanabaena catenata USMAC16]